MLEELLYDLLPVFVHLSLLRDGVLPPFYADCGMRQYRVVRSHAFAYPEEQRNEGNKLIPQLLTVRKERFVLLIDCPVPAL